MAIQAVTDFIKGFDEVKDFFLYGYCFWFSVILANRFYGEIWYLPVENHFVCKIDGNYYDVTGRVQPTNVIYRWADYPDEIEKARIIKDCIKKERI